MVLCFSANTKGEVAIGFGGKMAIIVDDYFRKHHMFYVKSITNNKSIDSETSDKNDIKTEAQYVTFSKSCSLFGTMYNDKYFAIWKRILGNENMYDTWQFKNKFGPTKKKLLKIEIMPDDKHVLILDKARSILCANIENNEIDLLFTNSSIIYCLSVSFIGDLIATGDQDYKIKINKFPNYNEIQAFCVGHTGSIVELMFTKRFLVSGGLDEFIKIWNFYDGTLIGQLNLRKNYTEPNLIITSIDHHCRLNRILVEVKDSYKLYWFDYQKSGIPTQVFCCNLPTPVNIIASCWDFHGMLWIGTDDPSNPIKMFFIDLEIEEIDDIGPEQEHRFKAVSKNVFSPNGSPICKEFLTSFKLPFLTKTLGIDSTQSSCDTNE